MDVVGSALLLVLTSPLLAATILFTRMTMGRLVFFHQRRAGWAEASSINCARWPAVRIVTVFFCRIPSVKPRRDAFFAPQVWTNFRNCGTSAFGFLSATLQRIPNAPPQCAARHQVPLRRLVHRTPLAAVGFRILLQTFAALFSSRGSLSSREFSGS